MSHKCLNVTIIGASPLLMHNGQMADPLNPWAVRMKSVSGKRAKVGVDHEEMARIEFLGSLYLQAGEPVIPGEIIEKALVEGGQTRRSGRKVRAAVLCDRNYRLNYDGPRAPEALWEDPRFRLRAPVVINRNRVMRTRPRFDHWSADIEIKYLPNMVDAKDLLDFLRIVGEQIGICDWRPRFGRFQLAA
ncbi:MAG: hypothetical protein HQL40_13250 [Alphaproteobacteria bacterium]|nr:hypothetical protein [Alphaproteobacteria bacterium]